jgi:hypothetical protein
MEETSPGQSWTFLMEKKFITGDDLKTLKKRMILSGPD